MSGELSRRFAAIDFLNDSAGREDFHIVTGFGPTNAPTAGTLSIMCGIVEAQRAFRLPLTVVISDLGAWNCRNVAWADLCEFRNRMRGFLLSLGFDDTVGKIRSHLETENLVRAGRIARYLKLEDFEQYQEEFLALYSSQGLLGSRVGLLVDSLYTVADILQPIERGSSSL